MWACEEPGTWEVLVLPGPLLCQSEIISKPKPFYNVLAAKGQRPPSSRSQGQARTSPCVRKLAISAPFTAFSMSQSEKTIRGDLPPSSKVTGLIPFADISMIFRNKNQSTRNFNRNALRDGEADPGPQSRNYIACSSQ